MRVMSEQTAQEVLEYNIAYQKEHGVSPSFRKIMNALNLGSLATVQRYVKKLEMDGLLKRTDLGNIELLPQLAKGQSVIAPLVGEIACGEPCLEVENIEESYALPRAIFGSGDLFMLRAFGDSSEKEWNTIKIIDRDTVEYTVYFYTETPEHGWHYKDGEIVVW